MMARSLRWLLHILSCRHSPPPFGPDTPQETEAYVLEICASEAIAGSVLLPRSLLSGTLLIAHPRKLFLVPPVDRRTDPTGLCTLR